MNIISVVPLFLLCRVNGFQLSTKRVQTSRTQLMLSGDNELASQTLILPVFPLRKTVRLPTESLTLNLYEERFLAMSERILQAPEYQRVFGAMYCSNKPHVVKSGLGPIVPLVEVGDIGVIFLVKETREDVISTLNSGTRRRIRLVATGVSRFVVKRVLQSGCAESGLLMSAELPYILVEAGIIQDKYISTRDMDGLFEKKPRLLVMLQSQCEDNALRKLVAAALRAYGQSTHVLAEERLAELRTFKLASMILKEGDFEARLWALKMLSGRDRLERL